MDFDILLWSFYWDFFLLGFGIAEMVDIIWDGRDSDEDYYVSISSPVAKAF